MRRRPRFDADARGGALVEFALLLPLMLLLEIGVIQLVEGMEAMRRVEHAAFAMADVLAQEKSVSAADLDGIAAGGRLMMHPLPTPAFTVRFASLSADDRGAVKLDWSWPAGGAGPSYALPRGYLQPNQSVVVAEVSYAYHPLGWSPDGGWLFDADIPMRQHAYLRPRLVEKIPLR